MPTNDSKPNKSSMNTVNEFLNPQSMLTPGIAGGTTMMIANVLSNQFNLNVAGTGLAISALFGALVFVSSVSIFLKAIYYVLNTLIIFCIAMGSGNLAFQVESGRADLARGNMLALVDGANAQPVTPDSSGQNAAVLREIESINRDPNLSEAEKVRRIQQLMQQSNQPLPPAQQRGNFFKQWQVLPR